MKKGCLVWRFTPNFKSNGKLYVTMTKQGPKRTVLSEFVAKGDAIDMESERVLMEIQQPEWNHNSGNLVFGPNDGYLYYSVGDGGLGHGLHMLSQRLQAWNGKVLRIDVNSKSEGREYGIPSDNPFLDNPIASPEIYAYGLRNPWGISIDPETGLFWLADVGQALHEEVNLIERGGNYGWNFKEGSVEFPTRKEILAAVGKNKDNPPRGHSICRANPHLFPRPGTQYHRWLCLQRRQNYRIERPLSLRRLEIRKSLGAPLRQGRGQSRCECSHRKAN